MTPRALLDAGRFAVGTFTALPVRPGAVDRATAGRAMLLAPLVGAGLGVAAGAVGWASYDLGMSALLAAVLAIGSLAVLTRALHLDGLADLADGLGAAKPADGALEVMRRPDIGPFGVVTLLLVLLAQVAATGSLVARADGMSALITAGAAGRVAIVLGCRRGVPAARRDGLGAHVSATVAPLAAALVALAVIALGAVLAVLDDVPWWRGGLAVVAGLGAALALERLAVRRLGGITGDVLGALVESATAVTLVVFATSG